MTAPQVLIVGAGIIGASCAYALAKRGAKVTVLERQERPATGSTGKSAAGIRHQFTHPENVKMSLYSSRTFARFEEVTGVDAGYRRVGYLFLLDEAQWQSWEAQAEMQRNLGAKLERLDLQTLRARYPQLHADGLAGAHFGPEDGTVDPNSITLGYLKAARALGASLHLGEEVLALTPRGEGWQLTGSSGQYHADIVVNAAGPFAGELGRRAGLDIPVLPYRRNVYVTGPVSYPHPSPLIIDMTTGVWARSEGERFIVGLSKADEAPGDKQTVDWDWMEHCLGLALKRFPFLEAAGIDTKACWAGLYEITPDHLPVLGRMPEAPSFINACGFSGHGVQHAPAVGLIIAEEVFEGAATSFDIRDFRYERFADLKVGLEANVV